MKKSVAAVLAVFFAVSTPAAAGPVQNQVLFLMDSSGSL